MHANSAYYHAERREMLPFLPDHIRKTVEFGCGNGAFSSLVKERYRAESWGIDLNDAALKEAETKLDRVIHGNAADVLRTLPANYFDCVICNDFLEHLVFPDRFLSEIRSRLQPGAFLIASVPNIRYWRTFIEYFFHKDWNYVDAGILDHSHLRFFTKKSIIRLLNSCGIKIEHMQGIHKTDSRNFFLANILLLGFIDDMKYLQYAFRGRFT